jgi:hypothetical protein
MFYVLGSPHGVSCIELGAHMWESYGVTTIYDDWRGFSHSTLGIFNSPSFYYLELNFTEREYIVNGLYFLLFRTQFQKRESNDG